MVKIQRFGEWCEIEVPVHWEGYTVEYIVRTLWGAPKKTDTQYEDEQAGCNQ
ncbi:hypothetical protein HMPREF1013_01000 [Bacillus sp. 2_A_57_CT2]|nr:hypothetical protein HMPREF1013_01000 [Bacillus sp. 2_A_57_CT2]